MKKKLFPITILTALVAMLLVSCNHDDDDNDDVTIVKVNGDITGGLTQFRQLLGSPVNMTPGVTGGRREINWDGVPDSLLGKPLPNHFFNPVGTDPALAPQQRGLDYDPATGTFMVSNTSFSNINPEAASQFTPFSGNKLFANVSDKEWPISLQVAGQAVPATVRGFGIVFSDVDKDNSTAVEFFNDGRSLGKFFVPAHSNTSNFSFLGVYFKNDKITHLRVSHEGFLASGEKDISQGGTKDLVVLDDFMYDEPVRK